MRWVGLVLVALAVLFGAAGDDGPLSPESTQRRDLLSTLDDLALRLVRQSPQTITSRGIARELGVRNDGLDSLVLDASGESFAPLEQALARIDRESARLERPEDRRACAIYAWWLRAVLAGRPFQDDVCLVSTYMTSYPQAIAWFLVHVHPLRTRGDAEDYLSRLAQIPARFDELAARLASSEAKGALAPRFLLVRAADQIDAIGRQSDGAPPLLARFVAAASDLSDVDARTRDELVGEAERLVREVVSPACARLAATVREIAGRVTDDVGIWRATDGDAYYGYLLRAYTTTDMSAEEIFDLGLREVPRIQSEIRLAASPLGYDGTDSLSSLFARLRADRGVVKGVPAVEACQALVRRAPEFSRAAFALALPSDLAVEPGGSIAYFVEGARDGSRPGAFYVPVDQVRPTYSLPSLVYHETIPGHALQIQAAHDAELPAFLDGVSFAAFTEGWATYAERLAWELGAYVNDPYGNLGRLQEELFRAARLVVDPGLHAMGWTYDQAVAYLLDATGLSEATVRDEVDRYVVQPGQAVAYGVGLYRLLELRERAREALGPAFDLALFHEAVLAWGSVPLPVLEGLVDDFIASRAREDAKEPSP